MEDAKKLGAASLFGEKYGDVVRVVSIGDNLYAELCGGTHLTNTAKVGALNITAEFSVASGVRRIESTTGKETLASLSKMQMNLDMISAILKATSNDDILNKIEQNMQSYKELRSKLDSAIRKEMRYEAARILTTSHDIGGLNVVATLIEDDNVDVEKLRLIEDTLRELDPNVVAALAIVKDKKITIRDTTGENELIFMVGSNTVIKNGYADTILQAPFIRYANTFLPLRYVSEFFNKHVTYRKSVDGKEMIIWVSSVQLLTDDDVAAERDEINYYDEAFDIHPVPYYVLKSDGQTHRGMKIGDSYEKVVEFYGEPHEKKYKDGELYLISYHTESLSYLVGGSVLNIYFAHDIVEYVGIDGRW
jgi:hypothetical protein